MAGVSHVHSSAQMRWDSMVVLSGASYTDTPCFKRRRNQRERELTFNEISFVELTAKFHMACLSMSTGKANKRLTKSQSPSGFRLRSSLNAEKNISNREMFDRNFVCKLARPSLWAGFRCYMPWKRGTGYSRSPKQGCLALLNMYPRLQSSHPGIVIMEANGDKVTTADVCPKSCDANIKHNFADSRITLSKPFSPRALSDEGVQRCQVLDSKPNSDLRGPGANSLDSLFRQSLNQGCNTCKA